MACAQYYWTGLISDNWSNPLNWSGFQAPSPSNFGTDLEFSSAVTDNRVAQDDYQGVFDLNSLSFTGPAWSLSGGALSFSSTGSISVGSGSSATISNQLIVGQQASGTTLNIQSGLGSVLTINGQITGSAGIAFSGGGIVVLNTASPYEGLTTIGTTVDTQATNALGIGNDLVLSSGTLNIGGSAQYVGNLTGDSSSTISMNGGSLQINESGVSTYAGAFTNGGTESKIDSIGTGRLTLTGNNSGSSTDLEIQQGTVVLGSANAGLNGTLQLAGGTLDQGGYAINVTNLIFGNGNVVNEGTILDPASITLSGKIGYDGRSDETSDNVIVSNPIVLTSGQHDVDFYSTVGPGAGATLTLSGPISGPGGLFATDGVGSPILALAGQNTYKGETYVNLGVTLKALAEDAIPQDSAVTLANTNLYVYDASNPSEVLGPFNQSIGSLSGIGSIFLDTATLTTGNDNSSTTFYGIIQGSGSTLVKVGTGTFNLDAAYFDTGGNITVDGGTLGISESGAVPGGTLTLSGGNLDQGGQSILIGNLVFGNGSVINEGSILNPASISIIDKIGFVGNPNDTSDPVYLQNPISLFGFQHPVNFNGTTSTGDGVDLALMNVVSGLGGLTLTGGPSTGFATLALGAENTYTGQTVIEQNTRLDAFATDAIPLTSAVEVDSGGQLNLFNSNNLPQFGANSDQSIGSLSGGGDVLLGSANLTTGNDNTDATFTGTLNATPGGDRGGVIKVGTGTWTLSGVQGNFWNLLMNGGSTVIDKSNLTLDSNTLSQTAFTINSASTTIEAGSVVNLSPTSGYSVLDGTGASLAVTGAGTLFNAGNQLILAYSPGSTSSMVVSGGAGFDANVVVNGFSGSGAITVEGAGTTFFAGSLLLGYAAGGAGSLSILNGGAVSTQELYLGSPTSTLQVDKGTLFVDSFATNAGMTLQPMALTNPGGASALTIGLDNVTSNLSVTFTDGQDGIGGITKVGSGIVTVLANQLYTGTTDVEEGDWVLQGVKTNGGYTVGTDSVFVADGGSVLNLGANAIQVFSAGTAVLENATVVGGFLQGTGQIDLQSDLSGNVPSLFGTTAEASSNINVYGKGTYLQNFTNGGTLTDFGSLTWDGGTNQASGVVTLRTGPASSYDEFESYGVLNVESGAQLNNSISSLTLGGGSRTYVGSVAAPGGVIDLGGQTLELDGGLLVNNGTIQNGLVNINYGGTAKGAGNYAGGYSVNYGGTFLPGNSPGTVQSGSAFWNEGGNYVFQVDDAKGAAGTAWGLNEITGTLAISAGTGLGDAFDVDIDSLLSNGNSGLLADFNPSKSYDWQFLTTTGGITGFNASEVILNLSGFANTYDGRFSLLLTDGGKDLDIKYQAVPSPSGALALGFGLAGLALSRRRRR